jgi:hypothetical protein
MLSSQSNKVQIISLLVVFSLPHPIEALPLDTGNIYQDRWSTGQMNEGKENSPDTLP